MQECFQCLEWVCKSEKRTRSRAHDEAEVAIYKDQVLTLFSCTSSLDVMVTYAGDVVHSCGDVCGSVIVPPTG